TAGSGSNPGTSVGAVLSSVVAGATPTGSAPVTGTSGSQIFTPATSSTATLTSVDPQPPDPAAEPGSGPSPPAHVGVFYSEGDPDISLPGDTITLSSDGTTITVTDATNSANTTTVPISSIFNGVLTVEASQITLTGSFPLGTAVVTI